MAAECNDAAEWLDKLALKSQCQSTCPASARKISDGGNETIETRLILPHPFERAHLCALSPLHKRRRMRQREADEPIALVQQHRVAQRELSGEQDLARVVVAREQLVHQRTTFFQRVVASCRRKT